MKPNELLLLRQKHGLSQPQAGRIIGVSGSSISDIETGKRKLKGFESAMLEDYFKEVEK